MRARFLQISSHLAFVIIVIVIVGCDKSSTKPIPNQLIITMEATHVRFYNYSDGAIDLTVSGGTSPYQYLWSNGESTEDIDNLFAGTYSVIVEDANGQIATDSTTIIGPSDPLLSRNYTVYVPAVYTGNVAIPLVIALHGYAHDRRIFESMTGFNAIADTAGFIVVYPDATGRPKEWNVGVGHTPSTLDVDDVAFILALIDKLSSDYHIDPDRIYATGFSNGSRMTFLLADQLSSRIAAIGGVAGQSTEPMMEALSPERPVAIVYLHTLDDPGVSYYGGIVNGIHYLPVEDVLNTWIEINQCETSPRVIFNDQGLWGYEWVSTNSYADIIHYRYETGGHVWPEIPLRGSGLIWQFFRRHGR